MKSQSLTVPSVEQEYACNKQPQISVPGAKTKPMSVSSARPDEDAPGRYLQVVAGLQPEPRHRARVAPQAVHALLGGAAEHPHAFSRGAQQEPESTFAVFYLKKIKERLVRPEVGVLNNKHPEGPIGS